MSTKNKTPIIAAVAVMLAGAASVSDYYEMWNDWTPLPSSQLPAGVYFARVSTQGHSARAKVVILH
jgi:hypothetical protein